MQCAVMVSLDVPYAPTGALVAGGGPKRIEYISRCHGFLKTVDVLDDDVDQFADGHIAHNGKTLGFKSGVNGGVHTDKVIYSPTYVNLHICSNIYGLPQMSVLKPRAAQSG